jgi:hypothetical protein
MTTTPNAVHPATAAREAIRAALATVPGVTAYASAPDNPHEFDGFPRWAFTPYNAGKLRRLGRHEYDALVILPAGYEPDTVNQGDTLLDRVATALMVIGEVQNADPIRAEFGPAGSMPALRVRVIPRDAS